MVLEGVATDARLQALAELLYANLHPHPDLRPEMWQVCPQHDGMPGCAALLRFTLLCVHPESCSCHLSTHAALCLTHGTPLCLGLFAAVSITLGLATVMECSCCQVCANLSPGSG